MTTRPRIVVLNNTIYRITEAKYRKVMGLDKKPNIEVYDKKKYAEEHQQKCDLIRKHGKKILFADVIWRDD